MLVMIGANGPQVYNTIFCTCVCMKASTIKKKVWRHHDLMEKGMEENPLLCSLCSGHEHWNKVILKEYWYCDLHVKMKVAQSCPILCSPMDCIVHGIPQAGILEWVAVSFSKGSSQSRDRTQVSFIAGGFFTSWATREALNLRVPLPKNKSMHCCWFFSHPVISDSLQLHGPQHSRPPCSSPSPRVYPSSCSLHWWCHPAISSSDTLFSSSLNLSKHQRLFQWVWIRWPKYWSFSFSISPSSEYSGLISLKTIISEICTCENHVK